MEISSRPQGFPDPAQVPTLSVEEAAHWLSIGRTAAYEGVKNGTLPAIRVGRHHLRVPTAALARLLQIESAESV